MLRTLLWFVFFLLGLALTVNALSYLNFDPQYAFLKLKQSAIATGWYLPAYYSHVLFSGLILMIGFLQVHPVVRNRWTVLHRYLGVVYVMMVLFLGAPGGLVMSFFINRGPVVLTSFLAQTFLWFYFTAMAYRLVRQHDYVAHEVWMWRSFSLTLAAITLRLYIYIISDTIDLSQPLGYAVISWLSWVPNLLVVEWVFRRRIVTR